MLEIKSFDSFKKNNDGTIDYVITVPKTQEHEIVKLLHTLPAGKIFKVTADDNNFSGEYILHLAEDLDENKFFDAENNLNQLRSMNLSNKPINQYGVMFQKSKKHYIFMYIRDVQEKFKLRINIKEN